MVRALAVASCAQVAAQRRALRVDGRRACLSLAVTGLLVRQRASAAIGAVRSRGVKQEFIDEPPGGSSRLSCFVQISGPTISQRLVEGNPRYASNVHWVDPELITCRSVNMLLHTISLPECGSCWAFFINLSGFDYPVAIGAADNRQPQPQLHLSCACTPMEGQHRVPMPQLFVRCWAVVAL